MVLNIGAPYSPLHSSSIIASYIPSSLRVFILSFIHSSFHFIHFIFILFFSFHFIFISFLFKSSPSIQTTQKNLPQEGFTLPPYPLPGASSGVFLGSHGSQNDAFFYTPIFYNFLSLILMILVPILGSFRGPF